MSQPDFSKGVVRRENRYIRGSYFPCALPFTPPPRKNTGWLARLGHNLVLHRGSDVSLRICFTSFGASYYTLTAAMFCVLYIQDRNHRLYCMADLCYCCYEYVHAGASTRTAHAVYTCREETKLIQLFVAAGL